MVVMLRTDLRARLGGGYEIGYVEVGDPDGPTLLHLHGTPSSRLEAATTPLSDAAESLGVRLLAPDRPGVGLTPFRRFSIADYPKLVRGFADALELDRFAITAFSGGGKYACACAWQLPERVSRVTLVASTCSSDLTGAEASWSKEERQAYRLASRAPWLFRLYFLKLGRDVARDATAIVSLFPEPRPADRELLAQDMFLQGLQRVAGEAFRQGARGPAHDYTLEARPWRVPLDRIRVPIEIWHGEDDRVVSPEQSRILARHLPHARTHFLPGEGHFSLFAHHADAFLQSALDA